MTYGRKLTPEEVREIRSFRYIGPGKYRNPPPDGVTSIEIANMYGVSYNTIRFVVRGRSYKHVR